MKKTLIFGSILFGIIFVYVITQIFWGNYFEISSELEVNIPITAKMEYKDNHGGLLYEGETIAIINFTERQANNFYEKIKVNEHWMKYPIDELIESHLSLHEMDGITIPKIENGYWFIKDRHKLAINEYFYDRIYDRSSRNFSVGIYDIDSKVLYYFRQDT